MFTLAHLSDPHLAPLPQPRWRELIGKRVTGYINWQRRRRFIHDPAVLAKIVADVKAHAPDHIAVTGDIANIALPDEFTRGRDWLESLGDAAATSVSCPATTTPMCPKRRTLADTRMAAVYERATTATAGFPYLRRRGPLALIGVTTGVPTAPFLCHRPLGNEQLAALGITLTELEGENLFRVVLIHHPPVSQAGQHKILLDAKILRYVIAEHGAELVIHGHDHLHMLNWLDGPNGSEVPAVGVPSASAAPGTDKDAAAYNLYRIDGAPGAWTCELISRGMAGGEVKEQKRLMLVG